MECNTVERATWQKCTQEQNKKERESSVGICPWHKSNKSITNTDQYLHATYLQLIKSTESHLVMTYSRVTKQKKRKKSGSVRFLERQNPYKVSKPSLRGLKLLAASIARTQAFRLESVPFFHLLTRHKHCNYTSCRCSANQKRASKKLELLAPGTKWRCRTNKPTDISSLATYLPWIRATSQTYWHDMNVTCESHNQH